MIRHSTSMTARRASSSHAAGSKLAGVALAALAAVACDVQPVDGDGGSEIPEPVQEAFDQGCAISGCHRGGSAAGGLDLSPGASDALLSARSSTGVPYVDIGDIYNSYLVLKMLPESARPQSARAVSGDVMPPGGSADPAGVATILAWAAGAEVPEFDGSGGCLGPETYPANLNFTEHVYPILQGGCILGGCHLGGVTDFELPEDDATLAYSLLVDVPVQTLVEENAMDPSVTVLDYVEPSSPVDSYMWHKLSGTHRQVGGKGLQMPTTGPLCGADLSAIYKWILQGAME